MENAVFFFFLLFFVLFPSIPNPEIQYHGSNNKLPIVLYSMYIHTNPEICMNNFDNFITEGTMHYLLKRIQIKLVVQNMKYTS